LFNLLGRQWLKDRGWQDLLPKWLVTRSVMGVPPSLAALLRIRRDLSQNSAGTAVFAHLLIPHHTYLYDRECQFRTNIDTWLNAFSRADANTETATINSQESRQRRYESYFDQLRCLYRVLREFMEDLKASGLFQDATIILHGDHGSRISLRTPNRNSAERLSDADLVDNYSVLYAVRRPGSKLVDDGNLRSIQALFAEMFLGRTYPNNSSTIVLDDWLRLDSTPESESRMQRPMPDFGSCDGAC